MSPNQLRATWAAAAFVVALGAAEPAQAQYRNQGIQIPNIGWLGLGSTWDPTLKLITGQGPFWNIHDQATLGAGYFLALGYNLWLDNTVAIGASAVRVSDSADLEPIFSLNVSSGLRYNFLEEKFRPFLGGWISYLQIISVSPNPNIPTNSLLGNSPFWVGGRFGGGVEYFFGDEMSVMADLGIAGYLGLNNTPCIGTKEPPPPDGDGTCDGDTGGPAFVLPAMQGRLAYLIYF